MAKKKKRYFLKINGDTMTTIVVSSLVLCVCFVLAGFWFAWNDHDVTALVDCALRVFGTELGICGVMTIFKRWTEAQDRRTEERRKRLEKAAEQTAMEKADFLGRNGK